MSENRQDLSLSEAAKYLLDECRMVLPGIQALFGFQLIAVFNMRFSEDLTAVEQRIHLAAIGLVAVAVALIMTPAALHRASGARQVTESFVRVSSGLLLFSMFPLAASISLDFYLVGRIILGAHTLISFLSAALFVLVIYCWFIFPRVRFRSVDR